MSDLVDRDFERILIIKPSSIGDVMHALPVLNGLRRRYPDAKISWLLSTACADLLNGHDALDEVIPFERKHFGRMWRSPSALVGFLRFIRDLRRRRFDLVIDLQGLFRSGFVTRASGAATRIGPDNSRELAGVFYTDRVAIPTLEEHAVDRYYRVAPMLGFADVPITFTLPVAETERVNAHGLLQVRGVDPDRYALVFASARWETKVWPVDRFAELVDGLQERLGLAVVLMGGRTDAIIGEEIAIRCRNEPARLFNVTLRQMVALIESAALVIGNESGPIHVAAALHRPLVTIIGPTSAVRTGPYNRPDHVARRELDCAPCYLKKLSQCPHHHTCLADLSAETVLAVCEQALNPVSDDAKVVT